MGPRFLCFTPELSLEFEKILKINYRHMTIQHITEQKTLNIIYLSKYLEKKNIHIKTPKLKYEL